MSAAETSNSNAGPAAAVEHELIAWAATVIGGEVTRVKSLLGGNRRRAVLVDVTRPDGVTVAAFLRFAVGLPKDSADPYTLWREAAVYRALRDTGVAIPKLFGTHPEHQAMLVECVSGHPEYAALDKAAKTLVAEDLVDALFRLHQVDLEALDIPEFGAARTRAQANRTELAIWRSMYEETGRPEPMIAFALRWLEHNAPQSEAPPILVHGDAGPGNFLIEAERLSALIDWELSHLGDPIEDIAWTAFRATIQPIPDFRDFLKRYEDLSGQKIDRPLLRYHRAFVATRVLILRHRDYGAMASESDAGNSLISLSINRRAVIKEIAAAANVVLPAVDKLEGADIGARLQDFVIESLKGTIAPRSSDPIVLAKTKSLVRVMKYLREEARYGAAARAADAADLQRLLGPDATEGALIRAIENGALEDAQALDLLWRKVAREGQIAAPALGVLAGRDYPPID